MSKKIKYLVAPNPQDRNLTKSINGFDESFKKTKTKNWFRQKFLNFFQRV